MVYVFDDVTATISQEAFRINFREPIDDISRKEAVHVADEEFLECVATEIQQTARYPPETGDHRIFIATQESRIRGYQGGLMPLQNGALFLVRKSLDAPRSPGMLDISAGVVGHPVQEKYCNDFIIKSGVREIITFDEGVVAVPELGEGYDLINGMIEATVRESAERVSGTGSFEFWSATRMPSVEILKPKIYANVTLANGENFQAGVAFLPYISSIEFLNYLHLPPIPKTFSRIDSEVHNGKPLDREIWEISYETGNVFVHQSGQVIREGDLSDLLVQANNEVSAAGGNFEVSRKVKALTHPSMFPFRHSPEALNDLQVY